jgi:starch phosphorylase
MKCAGSANGDDDGWLRYSASVSSERPVDDYTLRLYPQFDGVAVPLEAPHILWQR